MAISFVAAGTAYSRTSSGTGYTLNLPAGVADGDLLVATVAFDADAALRTMTLPSGWTLIRNAWGGTDNGDVQVTMMYHTYSTGDPSSWTGSHSGGSSSAMTAGVSAYRGAQSVLASNASAVGFATSFSTGTVNNTANTSTWRLVGAAYYSASTSYTISSNETTRRMLVSAEPGNATQMAQWDSNAGIATGNTSRTVSRSAEWTVAASVIVLLQASTGTPATGTASMSLSGVSQAFAGSIHDDATMAVSLGGATIAADGYGQPPVVTGTATVQLGGVSQSLAASTDVTGVMDALVLPQVSIAAETRVFGIRVITVEADDRTIRVPSRGVDD